jgi:hypothetical protein
MFAILFTLYFCGYHPYGFVRGFDKRGKLHPDIFVLLTLLYSLSICASPLVYGIMNNQLRNECMRVIFNCWHCHKIDDYKKYSHRRLDSTLTQSLTATNGGTIREHNRGNSSKHESTLKSSRKKPSTTPILDTACV